MKNKVLRFIAIIIAAMPSIITPKSTQNNKFKPEIVKPNKNISEYPIFERDFFAIHFFKQLGIAQTSIVELLDTPENILKAKNKSGFRVDTLTKKNLIESPIDSKKIVLYISSFRYHTLSVEDYDKYQSNDIVVFQHNCDLNSPLENHTKGYKNSKTSVDAFLRWISGSKKNPCTKPYKFCSLLSDNNKLIDIYIYKYFGCDARYYFTSHPTPIAILIDERGNILQILDTVQNEQDVFNAFGI